MQPVPCQALGSHLGEVEAEQLCSGTWSPLSSHSSNQTSPPLTLRPAIVDPTEALRLSLEPPVHRNGDRTGPVQPHNNPQAPDSTSQSPCHCRLSPGHEKQGVTVPPPPTITPGLRLPWKGEKGFSLF